MKRTVKYLIMLMAMPVVTFAQKQIVSITVLVTGAHKEFAEPTLFNGNPTLNNGQSYPHKAINLTDSSFTIVDTIAKPLEATLLINYKGTERYNWTYPLYLVGGKMTVAINCKDSPRGTIQVMGSKLSAEYSNLLLEPVREINIEYNRIKEQVKNASGDTIVLKKGMNVVMHKCWDVPRSYIKRNPNSSLNIIALKMMGDGDPTIAKPSEELAMLFLSLSTEIQHSEAGKAYWEDIQNLLKQK